MLPDVEAVVCEALAADPAVAPLIAGVGTRTPATGVWPWLTVTRVGGRPADPWRDDARLQVDCWGAVDDTTGAGDEAAVMDLGRTVTAAFMALHGRFVIAAVPCWVSTTVVDLGPIRSPDPITGRPRALLGGVVTAHPMSS